MAFDLVVRGGTVVTPGGSSPADVGIESGTIVEIAESISDGVDAGTREIVAEGRHVFPGLVDAHVHFNDPGRSHWEGVRTGSRALAAGGGTCFVDMPLNSSPPTLDGPSFDAKREACEGAAHTDFAFYGGLTPVNLDSMEELAERGVVGFKAFMCPSGIEDFQWADDLTLYRGMEIAARLGLPVLLHAESAPILAQLSAATDEAAPDGPAADGSGAPDGPAEEVRSFLRSRPIIAELEAINRALLYAEETGCSVHIVHISNRRGVELVRRAAALGRVDATAETCPHYLFFTELDMQEIGARAKCAPPLRDEETRQALIAALNAGEIDIVGSDHSPGSPEIKLEPPFSAAWGGIAGVQTTLRTLLSVGTPLERIAAVAASGPAARFGLARKGRVGAGYDADLTVVDLSAEEVLTREELRDRHRLSPYVGRALRGRVETVLLRGTEIGEEPRGQLLRPEPT